MYWVTLEGVLTPSPRAWCQHFKPISPCTCQAVRACGLQASKCSAPWESEFQLQEEDDDQELKPETGLQVGLPPCTEAV